MEKDAISEVVYREGDMTLFSLEDGVEIILGKEDQGERLKRAVTVLDNARKGGSSSSASTHGLKKAP